MFEVSQVSVFIRSRVILGDGRVWLVKNRERWIELDRQIGFPSLCFLFMAKIQEITNQLEL